MMESAAVARPMTNNGEQQQQQQHTRGRREWCVSCCSTREFEFQMPVHYPRYSKADYETMPEWKLDCLLSQYGLPSSGSLDHKRKFAMGAFLWP